MAAYGDPWYWQLRQYLWCHWAKLSIGFVYKIPLTFIFLKGQLSSWPNSFRKACRIILNTSYLNYMKGENVLFYKKLKTVKICVQNQWRVLLCDITDMGGVANIKDPHRRPLSYSIKLQKIITCEQIIRFCSNFHHFLSLIFLHLLNAWRWLGFIPL